MHIKTQSFSTQHIWTIENRSYISSTDAALL